MWYLGEKVICQHSSQTFFVPGRPPSSMLHVGRLREYTRSNTWSTDFRELVQTRPDYELMMIPILAPFPEPEVVVFPHIAPISFLCFSRINTSIFQESGDFSYPRLSLRYARPYGTVKEVILETPKEWRIAERSLPRSVRLLPREGVMHLLRVIDACKYQLIRWSHLVTCRDADAACSTGHILLRGRVARENLVPKALVTKELASLRSRVLRVAR
ncbi:uncharacterized protein LOC110706248 isoform X1 [Chenopodium quinoa]|uniref:uncharacterized protein LOC110706248 isoform X1 n=1 Tax=Chenopodium quinoa TaxID=63459 RepID=UPI000B78CBE1|nr:uncharacterized protein LOC110706248 isoform X1 [Chenopodium quinoa]